MEPSTTTPPEPEASPSLAKPFNAEAAIAELRKKVSDRLVELAQCVSHHANQIEALQRITDNHADCIEHCNDQNKRTNRRLEDIEDEQQANQMP